MQKVTIFIGLVLLVGVSVAFSLKISSLKGKLEKSRLETRSVQTQMAKVKGESEAALAEATAKITAQENEITELSKERETFKNEIEALQSERVEAAQALGAEKTKVGNLEKELESMKKARFLEARRSTVETEASSTAPAGL